MRLAQARVEIDRLAQRRERLLTPPQAHLQAAERELTTFAALETIPEGKSGY